MILLGTGNVSFVIFTIIWLKFFSRKNQSKKFLSLLIFEIKNYMILITDRDEQNTWIEM